MLKISYAFQPKIMTSKSVNELKIFNHDVNVTDNLMNPISL